MCSILLFEQFSSFTLGACSGLCCNTVWRTCMLLGFLALESSLKITSFTMVARLSLCALSSSLQHQPWIISEQVSCSMFVTWIELQRRQGAQTWHTACSGWGGLWVWVGSLSGWRSPPYRLFRGCCNSCTSTWGGPELDESTANTAKGRLKKKWSEMTEYWVTRGNNQKITVQARRSGLRPWGFGATSPAAAQPRVGPLWSRTSLWADAAGFSTRCPLAADG